MKERRNVVSVLGFLVVLVLIVPTVGASPPAEIAGLWNDAGLNTSLDQTDTPAWVSAGLLTTEPQVQTVGWNDVSLKTRPTPNNTVGWSDAGTTVGRQWFYAGAQG